MFHAHTDSWGNRLYAIKLKLWLYSFICQVPRNTINKVKEGGGGGGGSRHSGSLVKMVG